ncbi:MAG: D-alanyl-D-alanine carboxypeptidase family protein [Acidimicrobiia bacterium]|nr:D-alanyl-D-alanine carboxypeptidase family protein [Acidimicrobiia bacterium]
MPSLSRIASAVLVVGLAVGQASPAAAANDPRSRRQEVEAQRAKAAAQLNVLKASQAQIQQALDALDQNVQGQQAAVAQANQAADAAAVALSRAQADEAATAAKVAGIRNSLADVAIEAYMGTTTAATFDMLRSGNLAEIARRQEYRSLSIGDASASLDQLRAAREDLQARRKAAQRAKDQTTARRAEVQEHLVALTQSQQQQQKVVDDVENKIEITTGQTNQLAQQSSQLAAQIAAQGTSSSSVVRTSGTICLSTVRGITVACSIAGKLDQMLGAAANDGFTFSGGGYRDPAQQIAVRQENCGSSQYAVYQEPPSDCHPPTAYPGTSMHEQGLAVDFIWNGSTISSHSSPAWQWLNAHAATYGFYNLPSEPWHWSVNGH